MKLILKGTLSFDPVEANALSDKIISCEFHLDIDEDGGVSGMFLHGDYFKTSEIMVPITGFKDEDFFSLVAIFPYRPRYDESGNFFLDPDQKNHEMTFYGNLSEDGKTLEGNWEIIDRTEIQLELNVYVQCGFFNTSKN